MTPPYKTIVLRLLEDRPQLYHRLRESRTLLPTLERYARELKANHESLMAPESDPSATLEIALKELTDSLPPASDDLR